MNSLQSMLTGETERVGFVLTDGTVVEVENIHPDPQNSFRVAGADLREYVPKARATWHTHPGEINNLSVSDYHSFLNYPNLRHFIVGTDGVREYYVEDGDVFVA